MTLSRSRLLAFVVALLAGGLVLVFWPRPSLTPEEQVRQRIVQLVSAAQERQLGEVLSAVSPRFRSRNGWSKDEVKQVLAAQLLRGEWVRLFLVSSPVLTERSPTQVEFSVKLLFARADSRSPEELARESVVSGELIEGTFERESDGEWRVVSASHRTLAPAELL